MSTQLSGAVQVAAQGLYDQVASPSINHNFGELIYSNDGRAFRYARAGATALLSGNLQQAKAENTSDQGLAVAAAALNATQIVTTTTVTVDANEYAQGWAVVSVTPGLGKVYKIRSHAAASAAALTLELEDQVVVALTTSSRIDLVANPYKDVIVNPVTATSAPVGVAIAALAVAESGWLGVRGPQPVIASAAIVVGSPVVPHRVAGGAGAVRGEEVVGAAPIVGIALSGIASAEVGLVQLNLA